MIKATSLIDARDRIEWANNSIITIPVTKYNNDGPFLLFLIFLVWFWMMLNGFDALTLSIVNNLFRNSDYKSNARGLHNNLSLIFISYFNLFHLFIIYFFIIILSKRYYFYSNIMSLDEHVIITNQFEFCWDTQCPSKKKSTKNEKFIKYFVFPLEIPRIFRIMSTAQSQEGGR